MTTILPARGVLTDAFLDHLETELAQLDIGVGDHVAPEEAGWSHSQPQLGHFVSYTTVRTGAASPRDRDTVNSLHGSWSCTYQLRHVGAVREQADYTADMSRRAALTFAGRRLTLGDRDWSVTEVRFNGLGGIDRNDSTDPPTYECGDTVEIWLDRSRR